MLGVWLAVCIQQCVLTVVYFCTHLTGVCLWRECARVSALDRAREQLVVPDMSALLLLLLCNQYQRLTDCITAIIITALLCVALPRSVTLTDLYTHGLETIIVYRIRPGSWWTRWCFSFAEYFVFCIYSGSRTADHVCINWRAG